MREAESARPCVGHASPPCATVRSDRGYSTGIDWAAASNDRANPIAMAPITPTTTPIPTRTANIVSFGSSAGEPA